MKAALLMCSTSRVLLWVNDGTTRIGAPLKFADAGGEIVRINSILIVKRAVVPSGFLGPDVLRPWQVTIEG